MAVRNGRQDYPGLGGQRRCIDRQTAAHGNPTDILDVEGEGKFEVSLVDAAIPVVFIRAEALGLKGSEAPQEIDANKKLLLKIEKIRSVAAQAMGFAATGGRRPMKFPIAHSSLSAHRRFLI